MDITYIAFLRGINVGGHRLQMAQLRSMFAELGFSDIRSYIQSGNIYFRAGDTDLAALEQRIASHLHSKLGYYVPCFIRTVDQLDSLLQSSPFGAIDMTSNIRLCVLFCSGHLPSNIVLPHVMMQGGVKITIISSDGNSAYIVMDQQDGRPGNPVPLIEKKFGVRATMRFFHTTQKILAAAKDATGTAD